MEEMRSSNYDYWLGSKNSSLVNDIKVAYTSDDPIYGFNFNLHLYKKHHIVNYTIHKIANLDNKEGTEILIIIEEMNKDKRYRQSLGRFVRPDIVHRVMSDSNAISKGKSQKVSVLTVDILDFSTLTAAMNSEETFLFLNEFYQIISDCIEEEGGVVDRFDGDAVIGFFGVPFDHTRDVIHAATCCWSIKMALETWNDKARPFRKRGEVKVGVGITTGIALCGVWGTKKLNYSVFGGSSFFINFYQLNVFKELTNDGI